MRGGAFNLVNPFHNLSPMRNHEIKCLETYAIQKNFVV